MDNIRRIIAMWCLAVLMWLLTPYTLQAQSIPPPVADYTFQNTLSSDVGSAPALTDIGAGSSVFAVETVGGESRTVLQFPIGHGLQLTQTDNLIANDTYTMVVYFRFTEVSNYRKIIDVADGALDDGLYNLNSTLRYYPQSGSSDTPIQPDLYVQVALTRDQSGTVKGYVDGTEQVSFDDTGSIAVITGANILRFFIDDNTTGGEQAAGAVARIRLFDTVLSAAQIQALAPLGSSILVGDVNQDGIRSILDIIKLVQIAIGNDAEPAGGSDDFTRADANADGNINVLDVIFTANLILGLPNKPTATAAVSATAGFGEPTTGNQHIITVPVTISAEQPIAGSQITLTYDTDLLKPGRPFLLQTTEDTGIDYRIENGRLHLMTYGLSGPINGDDGTFTIMVPVEQIQGIPGMLTLSDLLLADRRAQPVQPTLSVSSIMIRNTPASFNLAAASPNPFNPQTRITYELPTRTHARLTVYNLLGQEIIRLVDQVRNAGSHEVIWRGRNAQGAAIASGIYVYRLTTESGFQAARRVTLLK